MIQNFFDKKLGKIPDEIMLNELKKANNKPMKEEYYIVPKQVLDDIVNLIEEQLNFTINNDCKLIDLSDEAIESKAKKYGVDSNESENTPLKLYRSDLEERSQFDYKQALTDIKQQIK